MKTPNGDTTVDRPSLDVDMEFVPLGEADLERTFVTLLVRLVIVGGRKGKSEDDVSRDSSLAGDLLLRTMIVGGEAIEGGFWTESPSCGDVWDMYQGYRRNDCRSLVWTLRWNTS